MMTEAISRNLEADGVFQLCEEEFAKLGTMIDARALKRPEHVINWYHSVTQ